MDTLTPAPDFTLPGLDGVEHTLSDYRGQIVALNFWSAECPWSKRADETLPEMAAEWGDRVAILSIASNANESREDIEAVATARGVTQVLLDVDQKIAKLYQAETTPHIFVIDTEGQLRYQGAFDDVTFRQPQPTHCYLYDAVQALLAGDNPPYKQVDPYGCTVVYHAA